MLSAGRILLVSVLCYFNFITLYSSLLLFAVDTFTRYTPTGSWEMRFSLKRNESTAIYDPVIDQISQRIVNPELRRFVCGLDEFQCELIFEEQGDDGRRFCYSYKRSLKLQDEGIRKTSLCSLIIGTTTRIISGKI